MEQKLAKAILGTILGQAAEDLAVQLGLPKGLATVAGFLVGVLV